MRNLKPFRRFAAKKKESKISDQDCVRILLITLTLGLWRFGKISSIAVTVRFR